MIAAENEGYPDVVCPYCKAAIDVEDCDDFQGQNKHWNREEEYEMLCPSCDEYMIVGVAWEPTYTWAAKVVEQ